MRCARRRIHHAAHQNSIGIYLTIFITAVVASVPHIAYERQDEPLKPLIQERSALVSVLPLEVEKPPIEKKFAEIPVPLKKIAFCESRNRQFDKNGEVLRGKNPDDIGRYQINIEHWGEKAEKLGYDLFTEEGNEAMALMLYQRYGTKPWNWSKKCWGQSITQE